MHATAASRLLAICVVAILFALTPPKGALAADNGCVRPLAPCPDTPNCIATNDPLPERSYPRLRVNGDPQQVWAKIRDVVLAEERTAKVAEQPGYLHATFTSLMFGFVDDVEITYCKGGKELWVRSASREGYWDIGANQSRLDNLVEKWRNAGLVQR